MLLRFKSSIENQKSKMLNSIIRFALRYRMLVLIISIAMMVYGSYLATQMPIDVFPDLDRPRVIIITECPGLATEEVETLVTQPIEIALLGASGVQAVRSQSTAGLNVIYIEFDWNTEIRAARQTVQERLTTLGSVLPEGILPQMTPPASIMGQIVVAGLYRQQGPRGGELFPIERTDLMAELVAGEIRQPIRFRSGVQSTDVACATWKSVAVDKLEWHVPEQNDDVNTTETDRRANITIGGKSTKSNFPQPPVARWPSGPRRTGSCVHGS